MGLNGLLFPTSCRVGGAPACFQLLLLLLPPPGQAAPHRTPHRTAPHTTPPWSKSVRGITPHLAFYHSHHTSSFPSSSSSSSASLLSSAVAGSCSGSLRHGHLALVRRSSPTAAAAVVFTHAHTHALLRRRRRRRFGSHLTSSPGQLGTRTRATNQPTDRPTGRRTAEDSGSARRHNIYTSRDCVERK